MDFAKLCSPPSQFLLLQEKVVFAEAITLCAQLQGELAVTEVEKDYRALEDFLAQQGGVNVWLRFTDQTTEGRWVDHASGRLPTAPIPWLSISEPTGFTGRSRLVLMSSSCSAENCSGFPHSKVTTTAFDMDCREKYSVVCQDTASQFWLRGLCTSSPLDPLYKLGRRTSMGRPQFHGPSGWRLHWTGSQWRVENQRLGTCPYPSRPGTLGRGLWPQVRRPRWGRRPGTSRATPASPPGPFCLH
jgi:hypothetical protein